MTDIPTVHFEGIKYAFRQSKDGIVISFVVHPHEVPAALSTSHIGARYMVALVEIGDDEKPVVKPPVVKVPKEKMAWRDLSPTSQAFLRCKEPPFWKFLEEELNDNDPIEDDKVCAIAVRQICGVLSRADLATNHKARVIWHGLDEKYQAWKRVA